MTRAIADLTWRRPKLVLALIGVFVVVAGILGRGLEDHLKAAGFTDPASESERSTELLRDGLGYDANPNLIVLVRDEDDKRIDITAPAVRREVRRLVDDLGGVEFVGRAVDPLRPLERAEDKIRRAQRREIAAAHREYNRQVALLEAQYAAVGQELPAVVPFKPPPQNELDKQLEKKLEKAAKDIRTDSPLIADDQRSVVIPGHLATQDVEDDGGAAAEDANEKLSSERFEIGIGGFAPSFNEVNDQTREDLTKAELIAFPLLAIMLLVVFRGVIAAAIPLVIGVVSILGTLFALRIMAELVDTSLFALNIATALSLGLAVDYALLMVSRYREELEHHGATQEAHRRTVATAGKTVLFSGLTVAAAMIALIIFPQRFLYSVAVAGATVAILASVVTLLAVPALLALLGERINSLSIRSGPAVSDASDGWYRLAWGVMRRPVLVAVTTTAFLLACAAPLLSTILTGPSAEAVPPGKPSYVVNEYVTDHYDRSLGEGITVAVDGKSSEKHLDELRDRIRAIDGIGGGTEFDRATPSLAYATFAPEDKALLARTQDAVKEIRESDLGEAEVLVSGNTARFIDQKQSLIDHTPAVVAIVCATTLFLLFMLTGSIILPIKTLIMNSLTLAASLGILVLAFQEGWFTGILDYTGPMAIEVTSLVFVFAVTFGLATDYAVLVMARIKEQHDLGASNEEAVAVGIGRTGRVITAAALMISVVFLAFSVSQIFFMKQISIAQAAGVLIDATIVRALLVPALMRILGEANWWAPGPLKRFQERYGFSE
ncbi:MAG: putative drug exporter of the superfamily [Solirubrobacterales bacterium]|jgi:RND superfamily putative drug exporter|nr:putative drug exporter of the superfamily [Solirubrobacterales bacterium]